MKKTLFQKSPTTIFGMKKIGDYTQQSFEGVKLFLIVYESNKVLAEDMEEISDIDKYAESEWRDHRFNFFCGRRFPEFSELPTDWKYHFSMATPLC
jgi:hypothetical protein